MTLGLMLLCLAGCGGGEPELANLGAESDASGEADGASRSAGGVERAGASSEPEDDADAVSSGSEWSAGFRSLDPADGIPEPSEVVQPLTLHIPDVGVEGSPVEPVGVEPSGAMEVPGPTEVGWYRYGPGPDDPGSTVLAAHIAYDGRDGVFRRLADLEPGAEVRVGLADGTEAVYRITDVVEYDKAELPFDEVFATTGRPRLALITCGGVFDAEAGSYRSNVVAYAEPVS